METEKFRNLRYRLLETESWPLKYMFKFIAPNKDGKVELVKDLMPEHGETTFRHTKNLKHVSVTCVAVMNSADDIIDITAKVDEIEGVLIL